MLIVNHTKCTASLHYYFLSEKKFPQIFFSWFWKTCEGYAEVHLLNPHLWKICWEIKLLYEYIFSSLWMSVSFGMLCVLSKRSVFTQEGFWTFIWIHPRICNQIEIKKKTEKQRSSKWIEQILNKGMLAQKSF